MQVGNINPNSSQAGGLAPYTWSAPAGAFPIGLSIDPTLSLISGTLATYNSTTDLTTTFSVTVQVTDAIGAKATQVYTMTLIPQALTFGHINQPTIYTFEQFKLVVSTLVSRAHAIRWRGREMRAPILDQPLITVADSHEEKVDQYHGDDRAIWTVDIAHGKERVGDRDIGFDEADPVVGERRLRGAVDGLLRLGTEVLHHCDVPLQKITLRRYEGSIFSE